MIDTKKYAEFVKALASEASSDFETFLKRLKDLQSQNFNLPRVLSGGIGMASESGEFLEIIKKIIFQGKELSDENREHLVKELGDIMWYVTQTCVGLGVSLEEVLQKNVEKLSARYPDKAFDVQYSEKRKEGDV